MPDSILKPDPSSHAVEHASHVASDPASEHPIARALAAHPLLVVAFCAAWCNTCDEFGRGYDALAATRSDATFVWLDIEDDADMAGDIDIENFPTIAVYYDGHPIHFGVSLPQAALVARLLDALGPASRTVDADESVATLPRRLAQMRAAEARAALRGDAGHAASSASTN